MSLPENIPLPSDSGIPGSRKLRIRKDCSTSMQAKLSVSDALLDNLSDVSTPISFDSPLTGDSKSNLVDSVFSNFVAQKIEEIGKDKSVKVSDKKAKHKKEKHKKHKHKDKDKETLKTENVSQNDKDGSGGFFAKEKFLEPGVTEDPGQSDNSNGHKSKKHKKHKKHKVHKHKHKSKDKSREKSNDSNSKLLSFHEDMIPDTDMPVLPVKNKDVKPAEDSSTVKKTTPKNVFADKMEKALELKLSALKENLTRKHKALEDLSKEVSIPEKKIKMMTDFTVSEKLKSLRDNDESIESKLTATHDRPIIQRKLSFESVKKSSEVVPESRVREIKEEQKYEENRSVETTNGKLTIQVPNPAPELLTVAKSPQDADGFRAMKPKKKLDQDKDEEKVEDKEVKKPLGNTHVGKKLIGMSLGLKLSESSKSLISSGVRIENDPSKCNREEGEITDSQEDSRATSSSSAQSDDDSTGEIKDSNKKDKKSSRQRNRERSSDRQKRRKSRSKTPKKRRRSRSRSYDEERGVWKSKSRRRRSRSRSRDRSRRSRDRDHRRRSRSRSNDRRDRHFYYNDRYRRSRSREKSREKTRGSRPTEDLRLKIDKAKLREIAMKNAYAMLSNEETIRQLKPDQLAAIKAGGKSVEELTDFCRKIAEKDPRRDSSSDEDFKLPSDTEEDPSQPFVNHPFAVKPISNIALNIRNAKQLPITTFADRTAKASELRLQFPVSSGSQHKNKEDEWTPVEKNSVATTKPTAVATTAQATTTSLPKPGASVAVPPVATVTTATVGVNMEQPPKPVEKSLPVKEEDKVFSDATNIDINISNVVSERLSAMRKLQSNPNDCEAMGAMYKAQKAMNEWAVERQEPGKFTGHTGLKAMSQRQMQGSGFQAWIKKDMFQRAAPVKGGIGRVLLQKMGWREGTGLGKDETGTVMPLTVELKVDRKGLSVADEVPAVPQPKARAPAIKDLSGKHPVSALLEVCKRRKWNQPKFDLVFECGPAHKRNFVFKVHVNGTDYQPTVASPNKKHAKAQAAAIVLQSFGLIPRDETV